MKQNSAYSLTCLLPILAVALTVLCCAVLCLSTAWQASLHVSESM